MIAHRLKDRYIESVRYLAKINQRLRPYKVWISIGFNFAFLEVFLEYRMANRMRVPIGQAVRPCAAADFFAAKDQFQSIQFAPLDN